MSPASSASERRLRSSKKEGKSLKRHSNLFEKIIDIDNLYLAHKNARKGKTHYADVQKVDTDPEVYIEHLHFLLSEGLFETSPYDMFVKLDKGKEREIYKLPYYPDRIVHWAIVQVLEPIWIGCISRRSFSSIPGRGIHDGLRQLHKAMADKGNAQYCLKLDIKKFYPSIRHDLMKQVVRHKVKDGRLLALLDEIIESMGGDRGVPIGNYLSQYFGNLFLSSFDRFVEDKGYHHRYFRYCDDIVVLGRTKQELHALFREMECFLRQKLDLSVKGNWQVFPTFVRGVDFLGYRSFGGYTLVRKRTVKSLKQTMRTKQGDDLKRSLASYNGWLSHADCFNLTSYIRKEVMG